jgi:hypothetical protein
MALSFVSLIQTKHQTNQWNILYKIVIKTNHDVTPNIGSKDVRIYLF